MEWIHKYVVSTKYYPMPISNHMVEDSCYALKHTNDVKIEREVNQVLKNDREEWIGSLF
jgi:hypothetical protein